MSVVEGQHLSPTNSPSSSPFHDGSPTTGPVSLSPPPPTSVPNIQGTEPETSGPSECVSMSVKPEMVSSECQATTQMLDAFCQTIEYLQKSVTTLDVAVQTIESGWEDSIKGNIKEKDLLEDMETGGENEDDEETSIDTDTEQKNSKIQSLLEFANLNKSGDDEYPCKLCKKIFVNTFAVRTHISVAHLKYLRSDNNASKCDGAGLGGVKRTISTKRRRKLTLNKKKWCNYCWIRFNNKNQYEAHRKEVHPEMIGSRSGNRTLQQHDSELNSENASQTRELNTSGETDSNHTDNVNNEMKEPKNEEIEDNTEQDLTLFLEPKLREELTAECLEDNRLANVKLIKVNDALDLDDNNSVLVAGPEQAAGDDTLDETVSLNAEFYTSLPWYEARYHHCLICEKFTPLGNFSSHIVDVHGISMLLYRERYPSDDFTTKSWSCTMCDKSVKWTQPSISRHLRASHNVSIQDYKTKVGVTKQIRADKSLPWYESRKHRCRICYNILLYSELSSHLSYEHGTDAESYRLLFPTTEHETDEQTAQWKCMICSSKTFWNKPTIQQHLVEHEMSLESYEEKYVEDMKLDELTKLVDVATCAQSKTSNNTAFIKPVDTENLKEVKKEEKVDDDSFNYEPMEMNFEMSMVEGGDENSLIEGGEEMMEGGDEISLDGEEELEDGALSHVTNTRIVKLEAREEAPLKNNMVKVGQHEMLWVPWFESKLHTCALCGEMRTCGLSFKNHIYDKHQFMSRRDYVKRFPTADIEPSQWSCNLCTNRVKWTKKCIMDHIKSAHSMSKEEYEIMFNVAPRHQVEAPSGGEYNFNSRTDIGLANKDGVYTADIPASLSITATTVAPKGDSSLKCGICMEPAINITSHINSYHKMTKSAYLKICPNDTYKFTVKKVWKCRVCEEAFVNNQTVIKEHLEQEHAIDVKEYAKTFDIEEEVELEPENEDENLGVTVESQISVGSEDTKYKMLMRGHESPWYESVKITCRECDNQFWLGQFMKHIILNHKMPIKVYRSKHPETNIPKKSYICRICGQGISHYASPISGHLTGRHNITMNDYYEKYEKLDVKPPRDVNIDLADKKPVVLPSAASTLSSIATSKVANLSAQLNVGKLSTGITPSLTALNHMDSPNVKNQRQAEFAKSGKVPWYECKTTICRFCNEEWLLGSFRRHLYDRHDKMSRTLYTEMFPDADISLPTWNCKICGNGVRWVRDNIFYHLRTHNFTMEGYRQLYIEGNSEAASDQANASNKPLPNLVPLSNGGSGTPGSSAVGINSGKKFRCKLCNVLVAFESNAIKLHLKNYHNLSINEYQPLVRKMAVSSTVAASTINNKPSLVEGSAGVGQHFMSSLLARTPDRQTSASPPLLKKMLMSPQTTKVEPKPATPQEEGVKTTSSSSLPWYNRCKWTCIICHRAFSSGFWKHVQEAHQLAKEEYLNTHGKAGIEIVHYVCRICDKKIPWSGASINSHTKADHGMTLKEYEVQYPPPLASHDVKKEIKTEPGELVPETGGEQEQGEGGEDVNLPELMSQVSESNYIHSPHHWFNGCQYKCQVCNTVLHSVAGLTMHLKDIHDLDKFTYFREHGRAGINIRKYRCKICLKEFPWSGVSISKHVKQAHFLSLEKYSNLYEANSTIESLINEMMNPVVTAIKTEKEQSVVERLSGQEDAIIVDPIIVTPTITAMQSHAPMVKDRGPKWYNKCSWTCQICGETTTTNSSAFYKHVQQDHGIAIDDYKEEYGNTGFVYVDHTCKLCHKKVPFNGLSMCKHLKHSHSMQLEEYEARHMKDDDGTSTGECYAPTDEYWYNKCMWKCLLCGNKNKSLGSSKKHIQKVHNLNYDEYISEYGCSGITEVSFTCSICTATMSCNGVTIASHLLNNHKLTLNEYEREHLNVVNQPPVPGITKQADANSDGQGFTRGDHFLAGSSQAAGAAAMSREEMASRRERPWYQKCQYFCQICNQSYFSISALRNHTKNKHNMDRDTYVSIYGIDAGKVIEDYNCKICNRRVKCEGRSLNSHMRNCHKMGILEYSKKYETEKHYNGDQDDPNYYSEAYEIEMDNAADNDEKGTMDYQDEDSDSLDPLSNYVTAELSDGDNDDDREDGEADLNQEDDNDIDDSVTTPPDAMTVEELAHFNFANEDDDEIQDESEEGAYIEEDVNDDDANMNDDEEGDIIVPSIQITADHHN